MWGLRWRFQPPEPRRCRPRNPMTAAERVAVVTASARSLPALMYPIDPVMASNMLHLSTEQVGQRWCPATIRHVDHVDPGQYLEQLAGDMLDGPIPG